MLCRLARPQPARPVVGAGRDDRQHPQRIHLAGFAQRGALQRRRLLQGQEHAPRRMPGQRPAADEADRGIQVTFGLPGPVRPGEPYRGEQQRVARAGKQPRHRLIPGLGDGQAEVEQRRAARDMHGAAVGIAPAQGPGGVGVDLDDPVGGPGDEPPWLAVVYRRRRGSRLDEPFGRLARQRVFHHQAPLCGIPGAHDPASPIGAHPGRGFGPCFRSCCPDPGSGRPGRGGAACPGRAAGVSVCCPCLPCPAARCRRASWCPPGRPGRSRCWPGRRRRPGRCRLCLHPYPRWPAPTCAR